MGIRSGFHDMSERADVFTCRVRRLDGSRAGATMVRASSSASQHHRGISGLKLTSPLQRRPAVDQGVRTATLHLLPGASEMSGFDRVQVGAAFPLLIQ